MYAKKAQATLRDSSRDVKEGVTPKRSRHSSGGHTKVRKKYANLAIGKE